MINHVPISGFRFCQDRPLLGDGAGDRAIAQKEVLWNPGQIIKIAFLDATITQKSNFIRGLQTWGQYINLTFQIVENPNNSYVRVGHIPNESWSQVGTNALNVRRSQPTINIGWDGMDVILHEIGHMIGLLHEHQNPANNVQWNVETLISVLTGPPNNWTVNMIQRNIINRYAVDKIIGTEFDPNSIMLYPIDPSWTLNNFSTPWNMVLSPLDIQLVQSLYQFPENVTRTTPIVQQINDGSTIITNMTDDPNMPIIENAPVQKKINFSRWVQIGLAAYFIFRKR